MNAIAERLLDFVAGPIQTRELQATFRGWRFMIVLTAALGLALFLIWVTAFALTLEGLPPNDIGQATFLVLVAVQFGLIGLLLPGFAGTSIVRERDQGTLELLATTTLRPWQIVWGQLAASLGYVLVMLFATLPLMAIPFWYGGLAGWEPVFAGAGLFAFAILVAMWSILYSAISPSLVRAIIPSYLMVFVCAGPVLGILVEMIEDTMRGRGHFSELLQLLSAHPRLLGIDAGWAVLMPFTFMFILAVNRLKPPGANRATPVRVFSAFLVPATAALLLYNAWYFTHDTWAAVRHRAALAWWFAAAAIACVAAAQLVDGPATGIRNLRLLERLRGLRRPLRLFAPGGRRGLHLLMPIVAATLAAGGWFLVKFLAWDADDPVFGSRLLALLAFAQFLFCAGTASLIGGLRISPILGRIAWAVIVIALPVFTMLWMAAAYEGLPPGDAMLARHVPGYLCMPWVMYTAWEGTYGTVHIPEVEGAIPVYVPCLIFHVGFGILFLVIGTLREHIEERRDHRALAAESAARA